MGGSFWAAFLSRTELEAIPVAGSSLISVGITGGLRNDVSVFGCRDLGCPLFLTAVPNLNPISVFFALDIYFSNSPLLYDSRSASISFSLRSE